MRKVLVQGGGTLNPSRVKPASVYVANYATPQLAADAATGKPLIFPINQTYTVASLTIPAGCYIEGNNSTLKFGNNTTLTTSTSDEILKVNGSGVTINNLNFDGNSANQSGIWSQHRHAVRIAGTYSNVTVKNCDFTNLIGDGVYISTQTGSNITVGPSNTFTANYDARNGVSVISGDTVEVFNNTFTTITRSGMPGPIDIEPNFSTDHLAHLDVHHNTIIGGSTAGTGQLSAILYAGENNAAATDIKIRSNDISGTRFTKALYTTGINGGPFNSVTGLVFDGNNVHGIEPTSGQAMAMDYWIGADVTNNIFNGMYYGIFNYQACLGSTAGNTYPGVTATVTTDTPHCS